MAKKQKQKIKTAKCKWCGASIHWFTSPGGRPTPVEADTVQTRWVITGQYGGEVHATLQASYRPHFGNCEAYDKAKDAERALKQEQQEADHEGGHQPTLFDLS